jgi:hypothetical protein
MCRVTHLQDLQGPLDQVLHRPRLLLLRDWPWQQLTQAIFSRRPVFVGSLVSINACVIGVSFFSRWMLLCHASSQIPNWL